MTYHVEVVEYKSITYYKTYEVTASSAKEARSIFDQGKVVSEYSQDENDYDITCVAEVVSE